jgi:D-galactarolactone cycloisomerase
MLRREFLRSTGALAMVGSGLMSGASGFSSHKVLTTSQELQSLRGVRVTKVRGFQHVCPRPKMIGKNSHLDVHGRETSESVLRIATDQGFEGIGIGRVEPAVAKQLIGMTLDELWSPGLGAKGPLGRSDHAVFDLVGKALNVPVWKLIGDEGPEWVPIYDGSIYFADLLPEYESRGVARILEEVEASLKRGHRAFKIKVGRGYKWMPKEDGFARDVEVVQSIRKLVGPHVKLMVDSNNGFDCDGAIRWLDTVGDDLFFVEEMFPENVKDDLRLKEHLRSKGWKTLVADGESAGEVEHFEELLRAGAIDVVQPDIRGFGLTMEWAMSRRIVELSPTAKLAPHNWGSNLGLPMQLTLARGIPNFAMAEQDTSTSDLFDTSAWEFREGKMRVPDLPGCGLVLREDVFNAKYRDKAWSVGA